MQLPHCEKNDAASHSEASTRWIVSTTCHIARFVIAEIKIKKILAGKDEDGKVPMPAVRKNVSPSPMNGRHVMNVE